MAANKQPEVDKFWQEKEESLGGKLEYQSYAVMMGESASGKFNGRGGLGYVINGRFYFEDFEKQNALMAMFNRKDSDYEKTEISFPLTDVKVIRKIPEKWGKMCIESQQDEDKIPTLNGLTSLFVRGYLLIQLKDRPSLIMEIMEIEKLQKLLP
ncbi:MULTISPECIES: hypothetical protein [unclassified Oceanispirochaeta]|uniref:hypothetical protein n=1 Tax=unclassified Oceanispirochaeta TaxID=2635722 RepID=UPI000E09BEAB|nr:MULTISPECIES: hypothetical protein [unclassified Oceanispirochaeta]MBF9018729.1 hypothetical protein [Oceanispirochaeta sp. M2]NPD75161.1 hypothetical protein [Oceanispirochaeta sp. M1]RDG28982.1 hypothetical protein DV872_23990 [Oceanispirochaeta sp. M1]